MPKVLTEAHIKTFERDGCLSPVRAMSAERARHYRERFEDLEARVSDIKKMKTKSHLLCPWVLEIAEDQFELLDCSAQLLRRGAEPLAQQLRQAQLELLVAQHLLLQPVARRLQFGHVLILALQ